MKRSSKSRPPVLVVCCIDYRFVDATLKHVHKRFRGVGCDLKTDAGGTKVLTQGPATVRQWVLSNLAIARQKHGVRTFVLVHHEDCAAFGGSGAFSGKKEETLFHAGRLRKAATLLRKRFRGVSILKLYASKKGRGVVLRKV